MTAIDTRFHRRSVLPLPLRIALRDLRGGLSGFYVLLLCIALGTGVIGAVNTISAALQDAIHREGKVLLGGDAEATLVHRQARPEERAFLSENGSVSEVATLRAMARKPDGSGQALIDLKAVDDLYPLYGSLAFDRNVPINSSIRDMAGIAVDRSLLDQLQVKVGDTLTIGRGSFPVTAVIEQEPDRLSAGPAFGAHVLMSVKALQTTGLVEPGSLVRWSYRLKSPESTVSLKETLVTRFPEAGFLTRDSRDPSPGISGAISRLNEFLTLVGLTAMLTGGIGIANAVSAFIERRRKSIATYKAMGATQSIIFRVFFLEMVLLAMVGITFGLLIAASAPFLLMRLAGDLVPIGIEPGPYWRALFIAALFGALSTLPFILWPLGRAQEVRAAELFRTSGDETSRFPPLIYGAIAVGSLIALSLVAVVFSDEKRVAAITCVTLFGVFALFWAVGLGLRRLAQAMPKSRHAEVALAVSNIGGPGSLARTISLSFGVGLTVLTAVSLVDASLTNELQNRLPKNAPSHFFIGISKNDLTPFQETVQKSAQGAKLSVAPMLRGRIAALRNTPVEQFKAPSGTEWVLNGDRGLTYAEAVPNGSHVVEGAWWEPNHKGENLVSFEADIAKQLGLKIGDAVTVNVLGRNITAKIANFRKVQWGSVEITFVMVFSPNTLRAAPFNYLATLAWPDSVADHNDAEAQTMKAVAVAFPTISAIRVKDALAAVNGVYEKVMRAVRLASSVTLIMGALVVGGALLTAQKKRVYEAVVFRTLGASKRKIVVAHSLEYAILATGLSAVAIAIGFAAAYAITTLVMGISFHSSATALLQPSLIETIFVLALGAIGTYRVLSVKPASYLRSE